MPDRDYYDILGIGRDADLAAIKKAYRQAAVRYHPDKNPGDAEAEENFKAAAEAFEVLSDPERRSLYDRFGKQGLGARGGFHGFDQEIFSDFGDILGAFGFGNIFGGSRGRRRAAGRDLRFDLEIEFEEAVQGLETKIQVPRRERCVDCDGRGAAQDGIETCAPCGGRGQVAFQQGFFTIARTCGECRGSGKRITRPCKSCSGEGVVRHERTLTVRIPAGVDEGMRLRLSGEGEAGPAGAVPGDLYVVLHVRDHPKFQREGLDLFSEETISFSQAALGAKLKVKTIDGEQVLSVPPGTQGGTRFRLRGHGVPELNASSRGDHYVVLRLRTPRKLRQRQRRLFEELAEFDEGDTDEAGLFDRVKNIFE